MVSATLFYQEIQLFCFQLYMLYTVCHSGWFESNMLVCIGFQLGSFHQVLDGQYITRSFNFHYCSQVVHKIHTLCILYMQKPLHYCIYSIDFYTIILYTLFINCVKLLKLLYLYILSFLYICHIQLYKRRNYYPKELFAVNFFLECMKYTE